MQTPFSHDIESCFAETVGEGGLPRARFEALLSECRPVLETIRAWRDDGSLPLLRLPARRDDVAALEPVAARHRERFDDILILGTGGSSLGGKSLCALRGPEEAQARNTPRLHFLDNVDPHSFETLIAGFDPQRSGVIVISKSGGTAETLTQLYGCLNWLAAASGRGALAARVTAIVEPGDSVLRRLAATLGIEVLDHDPKVGGRFSALSLVGLLPAMIAGLDAAAVRDGADAVLQSALTADDPASVPPAAGAALAVGLARDRGVSQSVLFPYVDRLASFGLWYRQLWAESLGKGGEGTTPLRAMGAVDQHSQLQLYLDGPLDKLYTVVMGPSAGAGPVIDTALFDDDALEFLRGRHMGDLLDACQRATAETLALRGRPVRVLRLRTVDEAALGALMMHFMLETIIAAHLFGVDAFDQPAVEQGKRLARDYMLAIGKPSGG